MVVEVDRNLIVDVGMSEGNDSYNYLQKGFRVFGIEADPVMYEQLRKRFVQEIRDGRIDICNRAALDVSGRTVDFWRNEAAQGVSSLNRRPHAQWKDTQTAYSVESIAWPEVIAHAGLPYYCKIDIEHAEPKFLSSMTGCPLPTYISIESHTFEGIHDLFALGYRKFKLVNQLFHRNFKPPQPPLEGRFNEKMEYNHVSGFFGLETPGDRWLSFQETAIVFEMFTRLNQLKSIVPGYLDCHATTA